MSWVVDDWTVPYRIAWEDEDGLGMVLGEDRSPREPDLAAMTKALVEAGAERDGRGFHWESKKEAQQALKLVKEVEAAHKKKRAAVCPCCKRPLDP